MEELRKLHQVEIIRGDDYHPVFGVRLKSYSLPSSIVESTVDVLIPVPRCFGYFADAAISGVHLSTQLHVEFNDQASNLPFCSETGTEELAALSGYYPIYDHADKFTERYFLCLYTESRPPVTLVGALALLDEYLVNWQVNCEQIADFHKNVKDADPKRSERWLAHLVKGLSPALKQHLS